MNPNLALALVGTTVLLGLLGCAVPTSPAGSQDVSTRNIPAVRSTPSSATRQAPNRVTDAKPSEMVAQPPGSVRQVGYDLHATASSGQPASGQASGAVSSPVSMPVGSERQTNGNVQAAGWHHRALRSRALAGNSDPACLSAQCAHGSCNKSQYFTSGPWNQFGIDPHEFLCDGGDRHDNAHVRLDDKLVGIELEDTVVKYNTEAGDIHVVPSNRVCVYAPRFAAVRRVSEAILDERVVAARGYNMPEGPLTEQSEQLRSSVTAQYSPERAVLARTPDAMRDRNRGVPIENVDQPILAQETLAVLANLSLITRGILAEADKPWISKGALAAESWSLNENVAVTVDGKQPLEINAEKSAQELIVVDFGEGRLRICKLADKDSALPGEIVSFLLRVDNVGDAPVENVEITDNLTTRLEYVPDSQTCSRGAIFETEANEGQSLRLTWKLTDTIKVGESAVVRFQCKVR